MKHLSSPIGVIGFGVMGASMARNLAKAGHTVLGHSRTPDKVKALEPDGITVSTPEDIASQCRVVLLSLIDGRSVEGVLFGPHGIAPRMAAGSLIIDTTTIAPDEAKQLAQRCAGLGLRFVDAPVTGGDVGARNGTLAIMCGGSAEDFERALPVLNCIGKKILHMGPSGAGQSMKAVNQVAIGLGIVAMTESLLLAEKLGLPVSAALEVLQGGSAGSWALSNYAPRLLAGDLKPGFDASHMLKDLKIALKTASGMCPMPGTETTTELFESLVSLRPGLGNHALIEAYKK
jgi:3-hydroxyisobutyrate dehydrogenase